jgi:disulfide oxidoreductase YuzD
MARFRKRKIKWLRDVEEHDYVAAESYLGLLYRGKDVAKRIARLRKTSVVKFKAKDIFRASQLSLLGVSNSHVEKDRKKIRKGENLSPLLLMRDAQLGKVVIADGYHRLCAIYDFDEDALIRCRII